MRPLLLLLALLALLAPVAFAPQAHAARSCGQLSDAGGFPGVRQIKAYNLACRKARRVARAVRRRWQRDHEAPRYVNPEGMGRFRCVYEQRTVDNEWTYGWQSCRNVERPRRRVTMRLYS